jgi:hypothetical protein
MSSDVEQILPSLDQPEEQLKDILGTEAGPTDPLEIAVGQTVLGTTVAPPSVSEAIGEELGKPITSAVAKGTQAAGVGRTPSIKDIEGQVGAARRAATAKRRAGEQQRRRASASLTRNILARRIAAARAAGTTPLGIGRSGLGT